MVLGWLADVLTSKIVLAMASAATVSGLVATVVSLRLALRSISDGRSLVEQLKVVGNSLTTRKIGDLPDCTDEIAAFAADAKRTLQITAIHPGAGIFSAPAAWTLLANALNELQATVKVDLLFGSREVRMAAVRAQFEEAFDNWPVWAANHENAAKLKQFANRYQRTEQFTGPADFATFGLDVDERIIREVYWGALQAGTVETTSSFIPVMSWIRDEDEAVFAIAHTGGRATAFITHDKSLIQALMSVRQRYPRVSPDEDASSPTKRAQPGSRECSAVQN